MGFSDRVQNAVNAFTGKPPQAGNSSPGQPGTHYSVNHSMNPVEETYNRLCRRYGCGDGHYNTLGGAAVGAYAGTWLGGDIVTDTILGAAGAAAGASMGKQSLAPKGHAAQLLRSVAERAHAPVNFNSPEDKRAFDQALALDMKKAAKLANESSPQQMKRWAKPGTKSVLGFLGGVALSMATVGCMIGTVGLTIAAGPVGFFIGAALTVGCIVGAQACFAYASYQKAAEPFRRQQKFVNDIKNNTALEQGEEMRYCGELSLDMQSASPAGYAPSQQQHGYGYSQSQNPFYSPVQPWGAVPPQQGYADGPQQSNGAYQAAQENAGGGYGHPPQGYTGALRQPYGGQPYSRGTV